MSYSATSWHPPTLDKQRIIDLCRVHEKRIWNIYLYGSQVYGTNTMASDFDVLVIASSLYDHKEFHDGTYNVHLKTPDIFRDELWRYKMSALECVYAPEFAVVQEKNKYDDFVINPTCLQRQSLSESHNSWVRGKRMILDRDMHRGMKSLWHSLRILLFADQILNEGAIFDFSAANNHWERIDDSECVKWNDFKNMLLPTKIVLEDIVRDK